MPFPFAAAATVAAPIIGGIFGKSSAKAQNEASSREAQINRDFQKETLQNQHQWEVADLKKAGLNPVLSANSGAGAAAGSMAPQVGEMSQMAEGASSALAAVRQKQELKLLKEQIDKTKAETAKTWSDRAVANRLERKVKFEGDAAMLSIPAAAQDARWYNSRIGRGVDAAGRVIQSVGGALGAGAAGLVYGKHSAKAQRVPSTIITPQSTKFDNQSWTR